jgi:hypothetical protein
MIPKAFLVKLAKYVAHYLLNYRGNQFVKKANVSVKNKYKLRRLIIGK